MWRLWEGIAADVLSQTGCDDPPVNALELADLCGLEIRARFGPASLVGSTIYVDLRGRETRQQWQVAHELGHWALRRANEHDSEQGADYVAAALLLPRRQFHRDLIALDWDLGELRARHPNAAWSVIAKRATHVADAVATVWDRGYCKARVESPWFDRPRYVPTESEAALADACLESASVIRSGFIGAWPVFEPPWRRVITLAPYEPKTTF